MHFRGNLQECVRPYRGEASPEDRRRNERAGEINLPLQAAQRAAEGKAKETRIERRAAHNTALVC